MSFGDLASVMLPWDAYGRIQRSSAAHRQTAGPWAPGAPAAESVAWQFV